MKVREVYPTFLGKLAGKVYFSDMGVSEESKSFVVPTSESCYDDLLYHCDKGKECTFKHMRKGLDINLFLQEVSDKTCSICQCEVLKTESRFGLLENCDHVFCLACLE